MSDEELCGTTRRQSRGLDRELSWLAFNERVLQEAADVTVPLFERLNFLSIYSSNLDEFFRVRVASLRGLLRLNERRQRSLGLHPSRLLRAIHARVGRQQEWFGEIFRGQILPELERQGIVLIDETGLGPDQGEWVRAYVKDEVLAHLHPVILEEGEAPPFLEDRTVYLVVELWPEESFTLSAVGPRLALVEVPSPPLSRFLMLPAEEGRRTVMFLDDAIRHYLPALFPGFEVGSAHAVKLSRDAELHLEDEFGGDVVEAVRKSLKKRERGLPARFLYDLQASYAMISTLKARLGLDDEDLVVGGRYHNLHDLADFPRLDVAGLSYRRWDPLPHPHLSRADSILDAVREGEHLLHLPYQTYDPVLRFLTEAAADPDVEEIWLTVYRVSRDSKILGALLDAAELGKRVRVFVEVKARFDEASNLDWGERMARAGIVTHYNLPGLKVHAKVALVVRREDGVLRRYAWLGTGNFNERTARFYADHGLFTADPRLTDDVQTLFRVLSGEEEEPVFSHLLVAPFDLRRRLYEMIDAEADRARAGEEARIFVKLNNLEDPGMIARLHEASGAGVDVRMIVRGICCLAAGVPGLSENIRVTAIVDRYLEHARVYGFWNGGEERVFLASADWMERNLSHRIEVAVPVYDPGLRQELGRILYYQLADNVKARIVDERLTNTPVGRGRGEPAVRSQERIRAFLRTLLQEEGAAAAPLTG
ncbi:MAG: polyphosphate kinase 1 [Gemmatimonadetes bacterium]|nr:polyphosphate kinase 1 [Gemmatimonadota bacterium]